MEDGRSRVMNTDIYSEVTSVVLVVKKDGNSVMIFEYILTF
jgi:hypothetical protein